MQSQPLIIRFDDVSVAEANRFANELRDIILDATDEIEMRFGQVELNSQDFGGTLVLVLGTPAVIAVAQGIRTWLQRRDTAKVTITTVNGEVRAEGLSSRDAVSAIQIALQGK